jgi:hypothetical protein
LLARSKAIHCTTKRMKVDDKALKIPEYKQKYDPWAVTSPLAQVK